MLELGQHTVDNERAEIAIKLKNFVFRDGESLHEHTRETGTFNSQGSKGIRQYAIN